MSEDWKLCPVCRELGFIQEGYTTCYDCRGISFTPGPKSYKKIPIPQEIRQAVFERDCHTCKKCGATIDLQADHVFPERLGGNAELNNMQTLCKKCNIKKGIRI